jgi:hypothetical protein
MLFYFRSAAFITASFTFHFTMGDDGRLVSSITNTISPGAQINTPSVLILIDIVFNLRTSRATNIPWNLALKKYGLFSTLSLVKIPAKKQ